jgi:hypothetical protein
MQLRCLPRLGEKRTGCGIRLLWVALCITAEVVAKDHQQHSALAAEAVSLGILFPANWTQHGNLHREPRYLAG